MNQRRNARPVLSGAAFLVFLGLAFLVGGKFFLPLLFVGIAFAALFGSVASGRPGAIHGGLQGFVWMLGIAGGFLFGWFPWIFFVIAASMLVGALSKQVVAGINRGAPYGNRQQQVYYTPSTPPTPPPPAPTYQPYDQGYHPAQEKSQEGEKEKQVTTAAFDQPQAQYPEMPPQRQEMPPQQQ